MKVFISWSGSRSQQVAACLKEWLPQVIQQLTPWMSADGIEKGSVWDNAIGNELKDSTCGIICLTSENVTEPWLLFEAGALYKGATDTRVYTFLLDMSHGEVKQPLAKFNHTTSTKPEVLAMLIGLNKHVAKPLTEQFLQKTFEQNWPELETKLKTFKNQHPPAKSKAQTFSAEDAVKEILETLRNIERRQSSYGIPPRATDELMAAHAKAAYLNQLQESIRDKRHRTQQIKAELKVLKDGIPTIGDQREQSLRAESRVLSDEINADREMANSLALVLNLPTLGL